MFSLWTVTGGRPMRRLATKFVDRVNGREVYEYRDRLGRRWLAHGAWGRFRVRLPDPPPAARCVDSFSGPAGGRQS